MKITILANKDLAANYALNLLLPHIEHHDIRLFYSRSVGGNTPPHGDLMALQVFEQSLLSQGLALELNSELVPPLHSFSELSAIFETKTVCRTPSKIDEKDDGTIELNKINSIDELSIFQQSEPDLVISVRYGVILKEPAISVAKHGVINLHSGLLPQYQGVMATFWAMLNGDSHIGTALHYIVDSKIDSGPIIALTQQKLRYDRSYLWNVMSLYQAGVDRIVDAVQTIDVGQSIETLSSSETAHYYSFPEEYDLKIFSRANYQLFDEHEVMVR